METHIPSAAQIRERLCGLSLQQLDRLADLSGVPRPTLYKIRYGQTPNPRIETVRMFMSHIEVVTEDAE